MTTTERPRCRACGCTLHFPEYAAALCGGCQSVDRVTLADRARRKGRREMKRMALDAFEKHVTEMGIDDGEEVGG